MINKKMVDLSHHNTVSDFESMCNNVDAVCIRYGYGKSGLDRNYKDYLDSLESLYRKGNEVPFGIYLYSYANSYIDGGDEINRLLSAASLIGFTTPRFIALDVEESGLDREHFSALLEGAIDRYCIRERKIPLFIYGNQSDLSTKVDDKVAVKIRDYNVHLWVARYNTIAPDILADMWQYTSVGSVSGVNGNVDISNIAAGTWDAIFSTRKESSTCRRCGTIKEIEKILVNAQCGRKGDEANESGVVCSSCVHNMENLQEEESGTDGLSGYQE